MASKEYEVGYYAIVHYGEKGTNRLPMFRMSDCDFWTPKLDRAWVSSNERIANKVASQMRDEAKREGSPLQDQIKVIKLFGKETIK